MTNIIFFDWILECSVNKTYEAYKKVLVGSAEVCGCIYCENFLALRDDLFQGEILELLEKFGIDYKKSAETYEVTLEKGKHLYGLWFHLIGRIIKTGNPVTLDNGLRIDFFEINYPAAS